MLFRDFMTIRKSTKGKVAFLYWIFRTYLSFKHPGYSYIFNTTSSQIGNTNYQEGIVTMPLQNDKLLLVGTCYINS
jgi:hypothetical protein